MSALTVLTRAVITAHPDHLSTAKGSPVMSTTLQCITLHITHTFGYFIVSTFLKFMFPNDFTEFGKFVGVFRNKFIKWFDLKITTVTQKNSIILTGS